MNNQAFMHGFVDEMEKNGIAFLAPLAAAGARALATRAGTAIATKVVPKLAPKLLSAGKNLAGKAMSAGTKGGVGKAVNVASNLGGMADIIRARNPKQPANAGNTITAP